MTYVNGQTTSLDVIKRNVDLSIIKQMNTIQVFKISFQNAFRVRLIGMFFCFYQILYLYKNKTQI